MAALIPAGIADIVLLLKARLVDRLECEPTQVFVTVQSDPPHLVSEFDLLLKLRGERENADDQSPQMATGRICAMRTRQLTLVLRTRKVIDAVGSDEQHLTEQGISHLRLEARAFDALLQFIPLDVKENWLTHNPVRCGLWSEPKAAGSKQTGGYGPSSEWIESSLDLEADYIFNANLVMQSA